MQIEILIPKSVAAPSRILAHPDHECDSALKKTHLSLPTSSLWDAAAANANLRFPSNAVNLCKIHRSYRDKMENEVSNAL